MKHFLYQLKRVKFKEGIQIWKLPIAAVCALFYRIRHKHLWVVCEDANEARDNGYWFFKYVRQEHPEQECVYAIAKKSPDIERIKSLGAWVKYGSLKHWILYLASEKKISSQKAGNPNAAIFYFLEVYGFLKNNRIFLQHGVIKDDLVWLHYDVTKMKRFICGAYPEFRYVEDTYGYPKGNVCYTGLCRFDGLHDFAPKRIVLIMPTWREWIADEDSRLKEIEGTSDISKTDYFVKWTSFLNSERLDQIAAKYEVEFVFFPHRNMQKYMEFFPSSRQHLSVADARMRDVQALLKEAALMITDYSSVFFDFLYMKKPVVFFQFDYDRFRKGQYAEGYFDYKNNPFANSYGSEEEVFDEVEKQIERQFQVDEKFLNAHKQYFPLYDTDNCKRVYDVVRNAE